MLLPVIRPPVQLAVLENALGQRLGRAAVARDGRVPVVGGAVACLPHKQSDLSISAQPDLAEHKMDTPAVPPSAGPGGYRRLRPGPGKWKSAKPFAFFPLASFCFCSTRQTGDCGMEEREKKRKKQRKSLNLTCPETQGPGWLPARFPPLHVSPLQHQQVFHRQRETGVDAAMQPTCQRAESGAAHASSLHIPGADAQ